MFKSGKSSKATKCKTQLKLVVSRIKLLRNKREIQVKHLRKDIAQLLQNKQDENARTRVDHAIREQNMVDAYGLIEIYSPRIADLPELQEVRSIFSDMYGKHFIQTIVELRAGCGVSQKIIDKLSTQPVKTDRKMAYMMDVAKEYNVNWIPIDPAVEESKQPSKKTVENESPKSPLRPQTPPHVQPVKIDLDTSSEDEVESARPIRRPRPPPPPPPPPEEGQQFIPFVGHQAKNEPQNLQVRNDPYSQYVKGNLNPYDQPSPERASERPDPYAEYRKKFLPSSYSDVASAAEAAAESADHAAIAARAAADLANKELSRASSSSNMSGTPTSTGRKPGPKPSNLSIEDRVAQYVKAHANDEDSSEWETPTPHLTQEVNPSRNLWSESRVLGQEKPHHDKRHSTGNMPKPVYDDVRRESYNRVPNRRRDFDNDGLRHENLQQDGRKVRGKQEKRLDSEDDGLFRDESLQQDGGRVHGKPDRREDDGIFRRENLQQEGRKVRGKQDKRLDLDDDGLFRHENLQQDGGRVRKPNRREDDGLFRHENLQQDGTVHGKPDRREDDGLFRHANLQPEVHGKPVFDEDRAPIFDEDTKLGRPAVGYSRQDSVTQNLQTMHANFTSKFDALFEKEDNSGDDIRRDDDYDDDDRTGDLEHRLSGWSLSQKQEIRRQSTGGLGWQSSEKAQNDEQRRFYLNQADSHLNFQNQFRGTGVDYSEKATMRKHKIAGASVRTRKN